MSRVIQMVKRNGVFVFVGTALAATQSQAAVVAADLATITTAVTADVGTVSTWAYGLMAIVFSALIGIGLVKKFGKKAAS